MTTAHRPTYTAARGHGDQGLNKYIGRSQQISALDAPHQLTMKERGSGQNKPDEVARKDLKAELIEREAKAGKKQPEAEKIKAIKEDEGEISGDDKDFANLDKDDSDSGDDDSDISGEDDDSDDETAELMRELEKIKKEREVEAAKKAHEEEVEAQKAEADAVRLGNPLVGQDAPEAGAIKRRWDDDVVFKNQARGEPELKKKRFINDTIRNDFHRRFMNKYIK
eukprot:TRINITY_DN26345_c0_g1_i1.p2 TRINITY_DN26345_c0_g1~~TRINITY_DN26345_c0_g1_i1.p2  ORF type:complete len:224 (+),score=67.40 TRINITY_DN26345_c0_g1_i1:226-897(+)